MGNFTGCFETLKPLWVHTDHALLIDIQRSYCPCLMPGVLCPLLVASSCHSWTFKVV